MGESRAKIRRVSSVLLLNLSPAAEVGGRVALHVASRLALIAFATVAMRGVLDRAGLEATLYAGLQAGAVVFPIGLILGELARRLIEDTVHTEVQRVLHEVLHLDGADHDTVAA